MKKLPKTFQIYLELIAENSAHHKGTIGTSVLYYFCLNLINMLSFSKKMSKTDR